MDSTKKYLEKISKTLEKNLDERENLIKNTRQIITLCSESIIDCHKNDTKSATKKVLEAKKLLAQYRKNINKSLYRYLIPSEQEFVEASSFLALVQGKEIPSPESLQVKEESYVLGLLDCIGEMRRDVYDKIRIGKSEDARKMFEKMDDLYLQLYPFAYFDKVIKEARRKLDVGRILVEETRIAITEEIRRAELIKSMKK
ncbi:MAG: RNA-binding protein [Nitrososphaeria archaeon]|nr:RNA-binding protein [Nitrososphaeria archaeon]NDB51589.1 RNA-binding protein [Nitrosopumilaceae archaeon]NDB88075.1 RNA-binding protein [Nitrososphaerota archaeon]NDB46513.1 RNA-binding protein [Nitrososphaeria archaeon]NDB63167.1 RNA-binding protein [Nitrosopumilaceae archaeon]